MYSVAICCFRTGHLLSRVNSVLNAAHLNHTPLQHPPHHLHATSSPFPIHPQQSPQLFLPPPTLSSSPDQKMISLDCLLLIPPVLLINSLHQNSHSHPLRLSVFQLYFILN